MARRNFQARDGKTDRQDSCGKSFLFSTITSSLRERMLFVTKHFCKAIAKRKSTGFPLRSFVALCALSSCRSFSASRSFPKRSFSSSIAMTSTTNKNGVSTRPTLSRKIECTLDPCVVLMKEMIGQYADEWKDKGGIFSLAQGVVYWTPPPSANQAIKDALDEKDSMIHMYGPDEGLLELREKLCQKLAEENGLKDHHVMVTTGANQAYMNCVLTLLNDTDRAVVFAPFYFNHYMSYQMTLPESNLLVGPSSDEGLPDFVWLESQLKSDDSIRAVTLVNPGNPTGTLLKRDYLQKAVDLCRQYKAWLILDCTYEYFVPDANFDGCFADPHVIHIFSFSKAYALAGYRCGYLAIPKKAGDLYDQMMKVQDTIPICPPRVSQYAALGSMAAGKDWVREKIASLELGRAAILDAMSSLEHVMGGSGAMYVMGKLPDEASDDQEFARKLVQEFGVACIPGSFCGLPGWIRVCYSNLPPEKCAEAAKRLKAGLQSLKSGSMKLSTMRGLPSCGHRK